MQEKGQVPHFHLPPTAHCEGGARSHKAHQHRRWDCHLQVMWQMFSLFLRNKTEKRMLNHYIRNDLAY